MLADKFDLCARGASFAAPALWTHRPQSRCVTLTGRYNGKRAAANGNRTCDLRLGGAPDSNNSARLGRVPWGDQPHEALLNSLIRSGDQKAVPVGGRIRLAAIAATVQTRAGGSSEWEWVSDPWRKDTPARPPAADRVLGCFKPEGIPPTGVRGRRRGCPTGAESSQVSVRHPCHSGSVAKPVENSFEPVLAPKGHVSLTGRNS